MSPATPLPLTPEQIKITIDFLEEIKALRSKCIDLRELLAAPAAPAVPSLATVRLNAVIHACGRVLDSTEGVDDELDEFTKRQHERDHDQDDDEDDEDADDWDDYDDDDEDEDDPEDPDNWDDYDDDDDEDDEEIAE